MMLPNVPYFPVIYYGILQAGGVVVPMNVLLKGREVAFYLDDSGRQAALRLGRLRRGGRDRRRGRRRRADRRSTPGEFEAAARPPPTPIDERRRARRRRHRGDPLHLRHHRHPEGRRADPRQPRAATSATNVEMFGFTPDDVIFGGLPLFHSFGQTCAMNARDRVGRRRHPAAALRRRPRRSRSSQRDRVTVFVGVPTMYVGDAARPGRERRRRLRRCASASPAARRCRSRCCAASSRRSARRCSRATGSPRPRRSPRFNQPTEPGASPARSARRSRASR